MSDICAKCGLPKELCTCEVMAKEEEKIRVYTITRRFGKKTTVIEGISKDLDIKKILKEMKSRLACGGTMKGNSIELQGDHKPKVKGILAKLGFPENRIDIR
ncbi:MAG: stress response translation initiation inhibitor YciH [Candidatus Aenigmatarchaeota archaeon]|nr:MAG: stress response translation initiation inhibitor YciH [Candidatus Aenigmarchaeota archaeon]